MAKKTKTCVSATFQTALERARQQPSQIPDMESIVREVEKEVNSPDFEVRAEIYKDLVSVRTNLARIAILRDYCDGLRTAGEEGRIKTTLLWQAAFSHERIRNVLVDSHSGSVIVSTAPTESAKRSAIYLLGLESGKKQWYFSVKKGQSAWQMKLSNSTLFFNTESHNESEDHHHESPLYMLGLYSGSLTGNWTPKPGDWPIGIERIVSVYGNLLLLKADGILIAFNVETQQEEWRCKSVGEIIDFLGPHFLATRNRRELVWVDENKGLIKKTLKLPFPKKDQGNIHRFLISKDVSSADVYISVYGSWTTWDKDYSDSSKEDHSHIIFYAVNKRSGKVRWSFTPSQDRQMRCKSIIEVGNDLYFCGESNTVVLKRSSGRLVKDLPYGVLRVVGNLFFYADPPDARFKDEFAFIGRDINTDQIKWRRKNFHLFEERNGLLFGRVGNSLIVLDEGNGKERIKVEFGSTPTQIKFIDSKTFLVVLDKEVLVAIRMNV